MIYIIGLFNLLISFCVFLFSDNDLLNSGYLIFWVQALINIPCLLNKTKYIYSFFLPSYLLLFYVTVNQLLGGYLASNGYGWNKGIINSYFYIENIKLIFFYLLLVNFCMLLVTYDALSRIKKPTIIERYKDNRFLLNISLFFLFCFFSILQKDWLFSLQLVLIIFLISSTYFLKNKFRYFVYLLFIFIMLSFNYESKREILMTLILILFVESYFNSIEFKFNLKTIFLSFLSFFIFISFVLIASIMRGYGELDNRDVLTSINYLPSYISSETFMDSVSDNFELGYNYIVSMLSIEYVINGRIDYLYGMSFLKTLFLPFPREIFDMKPDNIMIIFTKELDYSFYSIGGSYPINLSSELFINFNFFGIFIFYILMYFFNHILINMVKLNFGGYYFLLSVFFITIFFIFMRGSGLDLLVFCMVLAALSLALLCVFSGKLKVR